MSIPDVTFIVPTYKRNDLLRKCIDSILCQKGAEFEILLVDQNENASAKYIVENIKDERVKYLPYTRVMGVSAARNHALGQAEGKFVAFVDDDDQLCENYLARMYAFIREDSDKPDFVWCYQKIHVLDDTGELVETGFRKVNSNKGVPFHYALKIGAGGMLLKRSAIESAGGFDESLRFSEDRELVLELLSRGFIYKSVEELLYKRFCHQDDRLSDKSGSLRGAITHEKIYYKHKDFLQQNTDLNIAYLDLIARDYYLSGDVTNAVKYGRKSLKIKPYRIKSIRRLLKYQFGSF